MFCGAVHDLGVFIPGK